MTAPTNTWRNLRLPLASDETESFGILDRDDQIIREP
jgi:hypothetical protein